MRITFVTNGCAVYESHGFRLVSDPWLTNGAFEGSWCHYPPLKTRPEELARETDAVYISHIHPDHYDPVSLAAFRKDTPIVLLEDKNKFLPRRVAGLGFTNIITVPSEQSVKVGPYELTLLEPFEKHHFQTAEIGNLIDSSIIVDDGAHRVLNCNDNIPRAETAGKIAERLGPFDLVQMQYCAAGPYPSCFDNLGDEGKKAACTEVRERYLQLFIDVMRAVKPKYAMPFAGDFVLGGSQWRKNRVLGTSPQESAVSRLRSDCPDIVPVLLGEGMTFDLATGKTEGQFTRYDEEEMMSYIENTLARLKYPHEEEPLDTSSLMSFFVEALPRARDNFRVWQQRLRYDRDLNIYLVLPDKSLFHFNPAAPGSSFVRGEPQLPYLKCSMDPRLLRRILTREAHWNNAEGGCHIDFDRKPDRYDTDLHTMLSFLHLAVEKTGGAKA